MLKSWILVAIGVLAVFSATSPRLFAQTDEDGTLKFEIKSYSIEGNTVLPQKAMEDAVGPFAGQGKTVADVEKAKEALERFYREQGYPTVFVEVPEQTVESGIVRFVVIEGKIRKVRITGNKYYTMEKIRQALPSFSEGSVPYAPKLQEEIARLNSNPDIKVKPQINPAEEVGQLDVELIVEDKLPLHATLEISNRASPNTTDLRLNGVLHYDNLWQRDHSLTLQYQTSPLDVSEVQVVAASYVLPLPWRENDHLAVYGLWSDSQTAFGEGFNTVGKGQIFGLRYVLPLPAYKKYSHNLIWGIDYKSFEDVLGFDTLTTTESESSTSVPYLPFSAAYSAMLQDKWGITQFSAGVNMAFRGLVTRQEDFESKRFNSRGSYIFMTAGVERRQVLPGDTSFYLKVDGQVSDQPLISNEEYSAGGMESVRGYHESEVLGDNAIHTTVEFSGPELLAAFHFNDNVKNLGVTPYTFFEFAALKILEPLPDQTEYIDISSAGFGFRGHFKNMISYDFGFGVPFAGTEHTDAYEPRGYFLVKYMF